jgi:RNA polymerase sigma-70 factor (ECF subfamily)
MADRAGADDDRQHSKPALDVATLVVAHHAAVYRYACRLCGCPTEAEDLAQQTFLIAQRKLHQIREPERACSWLLAVVRSCFLKSIRKPRPVPAQNIDLDVNQIAEETPETDEIDREQLAAALAELPDEFRLVVLMFYFEDLPYQEIAAALEIPIGTVMSRLSRAKGHLRKTLTRRASEGVPSPAAGAPSLARPISVT